MTSTSTSTSTSTERVSVAAILLFAVAGRATLYTSRYAASRSTSRGVGVGEGAWAERRGLSSVRYKIIARLSLDCIGGGVCVKTQDTI